MHAQNPDVAGAHCVRCGDVFLGLDLEYLAPKESRRRRPSQTAQECKQNESRDGGVQLQRERGPQANHEVEPGKRQEDFSQSHHQTIGPAAEVPGRASQDQRQEQRKRHGGRRQQQGHGRSMAETGVKVAAEFVGTQWEPLSTVFARSGVGKLAVSVLRRIEREHRGEHRHQIRQYQQGPGNPLGSFHRLFHPGSVLGSDRYNRRSPVKFPANKRNAENTARSTTRNRSRRSTASTINWPMPGQLITTSTSSEALNRLETEKPNRVASGFQALGKAWRSRIRDLPTPLACAVRTKGAASACQTDVAVCRITTGNHPEATAKTGKKR